MAAYQIMIDDESTINQVMEKLSKHYPDHYKHHSIKGLVFLRTENIAEEIANNLGINGPDKESTDSTPTATGAVFKLNAHYSGFTQRGIWQWFRKGNN